MSQYDETNTSTRPRFFLLGLLTIVVVAFLIGLALVVGSVRQRSENLFVLSVARALSLPIAKINGVRILYADYIEDLGTLKRLYQSQPAAFPAFTADQVSDQALSRLLVNAMVRQLASEYRVAATDEEVAKVKAELLAVYPSPVEAETELKSQYGWSLDKYTAKVIRPLVLEQKLQTAFAQSSEATAKAYESGEEVKARHILFRVNDATEEKDVKKQAEAVLARLKAGENFAELARQFGSDGTKDKGGDLGWFKRGVMVAEFEQAAFALPSGELGNDLVKTQFGYHIIKVDERRPFRDFSAFMDDQLRRAKIEILLNVHNPFAAIDEIQSPVNLAPVDTEATTSTAAGSG